MIRSNLGKGFVVIWKGYSERWFGNMIRSDLEKRFGMGFEVGNMTRSYLEKRFGVI